MSSSVLQTKHLYITSTTGTYDSNDDYLAKMSRTINNVKTISLVSFNIPWSWMNVTSFTNSISITENDNPPRIIRIPVGQYTTATFMSAVGIALTAGSMRMATYTVQSSAITCKFTIHSNSSTFFTIHAAGTTAKALLGTGNDDLQAVANGGGGYDLTPPYRFDLLPVKELQIHLPGVVRGLTLETNNNVGSLIHQISLANYSFGQYMCYEGQPLPIEIPPSTNLKDLSVSITDQDGFTPDFDARTPLSMVFEITFRDVPF